MTVLGKICLKYFQNQLTNICDYDIIRVSKETKGVDSTMLLNGEKISIKQFAKDYKPTAEDCKVYNKIDMFCKLYNIKSAFAKYISYATFDDLTEDELETILEDYDNYITENGYSDKAIANIIIDDTTDFEDRLKYMNLETGEVMTERAMRKQFRDDYDGDDPTNSLTWEEYYKRI